MVKQLGRTERRRLAAFKLHHQGKSTGAIARKLKASPHFVRNAVSRLEETGSVYDRPRSGRKPALAGIERERLVKKVKGRKRQSTRKTVAQLKSKMSKSTVHRTLRGAGLYPHRRKRRPRLSDAQKQRRVTFATEFRRTDWSNHVFWDEKVFYLTHPPNPKNDVVWDERGAEYFKEEQAHPLSYNVGLAISTRGPTRVIPYEGTINSNKFMEMAEQAIEDADNMFQGERYTWLMDGASCHRSKATQAWMSQEVPDLFPYKKWPANSPDISPIENVFGYVQDQVDQKNPKDLKSLKRIVNSQFKQLSAEKCKKFISALPGRLKRIIESKGEYCYD
jgi:transposase